MGLQMGWFNHQLADLGDPFWELGSNLSWDPRWLECLLRFLFFFGFRCLFIFVQWGWSHHVFGRHKEFVYVHPSKQQQVVVSALFFLILQWKELCFDRQPFGETAHRDTSIQIVLFPVWSDLFVPWKDSRQDKVCIFKQWKNLGCLGYIGDEQLPNYVGSFHKPWHKDPSEATSNQYFIESKAGFLGGGFKHSSLFGEDSHFG